MKKLFYLASGIILCASFLPKEVNAKPIKIRPDRGGELLNPKEARAMIGSPARKKTCKNKSTEFTFLRTKRSGVIGKKYGRVFRSSSDAEVFFENICMSSNPGKMMKKGF